MVQQPGLFKRIKRWREGFACFIVNNACHGFDGMDAFFH